MNGITPYQPLVGRAVEIARLRALTHPIDDDLGRGLVVLGGPGTGKSALLTDLTAYARSRGQRVLSAAGRARESSRPFAGLRQLLRPVLIEVLALSGPHAEELRAALGTTGARAETNRDLVGSALIDLLAHQAEAGRGVLIAVDDAHWMDNASLDVLARTADRLCAGQAIILAARSDLPPAEFADTFPELRLSPLAAADARDLLDSQPCPPQGRARAQVLAQAAGNPLALIELARAISDDPDAERSCAGLPLPLTSRLSAAFVGGIGKLPVDTRQALLVIAAAAGIADRDAIVRAAPMFDPGALAPAEQRGLVTVDTAGARLRHPVIRSAIYHGAPFASRAAAHRQVAGLLHDQADRRAWHLAAATLQPDEDVAAMLAATAQLARQGGGPAAHALALERAGELSPDSALGARRLLAAAEAAVSAGQNGWARDLAIRSQARTNDQQVWSRCQYVQGWALTGAGRPADAVRILIPLAQGGTAADPGEAWETAGLAATAAYQAGDPDTISALADTAAVLPEVTDTSALACRAWALAVSGRRHEAATLLRHLATASASGPDLHHAGAAAWALDHTPDAIRLLEAARTGYAEPATRAASGGALAALGWAYLDAGRWDDALHLMAADGSDPGTDIADAAGSLIAATIAVHRGDTSRARELVATALATDSEQGRLVTARARHAVGLCALADNDYSTAFNHLRQLFENDGTPYHPHVSCLAVADLALASARAGHRDDGRQILKQAAAVPAVAQSWSTPRLRQLLARADGLLADPSAPCAYPDDVLSDPAGEQWPLERAQLSLEYGEWLRRHRRINQAKPVLAAALDTFRALKAQPGARRAENELRACGIAVPENMADADGLRTLTPQQRRIVQLAAQGLSNAEIAQRLVLSPRTVASHLYRCFPKLGVAGRWQLQDLLAVPGQRGALSRPHVGS
jgi:DNA-binding CsgD family transcriptional regulator/tetratricopeptide (TPR) repeat protein